MSKIVVDQIQAPGGAALTLPASNGDSGQFMTTDGNGNLSFSSVEIPSPIKVKSFTLDGSSYSSAGTKIMWTDVDPSIDTADIINVRISGYLLSTSNFQARAMGLNSSMEPITTGYLGYGRREWYNGSTETHSSSHNSNQGWVEFSTYTTAYGSGSNTYGHGMMFDYLMVPQTDGSKSGHFHRIDYVYQQTTSYDHPNHGVVAWNSYGSSNPPETWHGVSIYPTAGSWDTSAVPPTRVLVEILLAS